MKKTKQPFVSILLPVYKNQDHLRMSVKCLTSQTYKYIEIIAIDDFSPNSSFQILKALAKRYKRLTVKRNKKHYGLAVTLNRAVKKAKGQFIAFASPHDTASWAQGIGLIMKQLGNLLTSHGVEEIKTVGEQFDATYHEAVGEEESEFPEHQIIREVEGGYRREGKVLKVAKVIVAKQVHHS